MGGEYTNTLPFVMHMHILESVPPSMQLLKGREGKERAAYRYASVLDRKIGFPA